MRYFEIKFKQAGKLESYFGRKHMFGKLMSLSLNVFHLKVEEKINFL